MLFPKLEESIRRAGHALDHATSDSVIGLCKQYLALLAEYRAELYKLPDTLGIDRWSGSFLWEDAEHARKAIRAAIEKTTRERNATEALLLSFTSVSGYEAVETFNRRKYRGFADWELRAGGVVRFSGDVAGERMTVRDAVDAASLLRREEHVARSAASAGAATRHDLPRAVPPVVSEGSAR